MNFNYEHSEFSITSRNKCCISKNYYVFQVFTLKPRTVRKEVPAKKEIFIRTIKKVGRGCYEVE